MRPLVTERPSRGRNAGRRRRNPLLAASRRTVRDTRESLDRWQLWTALAWEDLRDRYRRTFLGILWIALSFALFCGVKILIFGTLAKASFSFFSAYVVVGFLCWQFISPVVTDGCNAFISARGFIKGSSVPLSVFVFQSVARVSIITFFNAVVATIILIFVGYPKSPVALAVVPAILIYLITAFPVQLILGTAASAIRDLGPIVSTAMRILFFLTPIIWIPSELGRVGEVAWFNPIAHYIEVVRAPILYGSVPLTSWMVVLSCTLAFWILALPLYGNLRRRIVYWL